MSEEMSIVSKFNELTPGAQLIAEFEMNGEHAAKKSRELTIEAQQILDEGVAGLDPEEKLARYKAVKEVHEIEILTAKESLGHDVKKKNGKWNFSKVCKNSTYKSNKSAIMGAIGAGVPLLDANGDPVPKNQLIKEAREVRGATGTSKTKPEMTPEERFIKYSRLAIAAVEDMFKECELSTTRAKTSALINVLQETYDKHS